MSDFQCSDYRDVIRPEELAGHRQRMRSRARGRALQRLMERFPKTWAQYLAEELSAMERETDVLLAREARRKAREGAA
jgi:hypothetical protein